MEEAGRLNPPLASMGPPPPPAQISAEAEREAEEEDQATVDDLADGLSHKKAWELLKEKSNDKNLSADDLRKFIVEVCDKTKEESRIETCEMTAEEKEACKKQHGTSTKRSSDKAFSGTLKILQRGQNIIPASSGWKPSIRLGHFDPSTGKKRKVNLLSRQEAADPPSSTEDDGQVLGPTQQQKMKVKLTSRNRRSDDQSQSYSASSSSSRAVFTFPVAGGPYLHGQDHDISYKKRGE